MSYKTLFLIVSLLNSELGYTFSQHSTTASGGSQLPILQKKVD